VAGLERYTATRAGGRQKLGGTPYKRRSDSSENLVAVADIVNNVIRKGCKTSGVNGTLLESTDTAATVCLG